MKALEIFAKENNLKVIPIKYKTQGFYLKRKGFDLVRDNIILISFEPVSFTSETYKKDKWLLKHLFEGNNIKERYLHRITLKWLRENINVHANNHFIINL